jgi:hypothetical protein
MSTPEHDRRTQNLIGIASIVLLVVFFIVEFAGYINFVEWIVLVTIVFIVANLWLRKIKRRQQIRQL